MYNDNSGDVCPTLLKNFENFHASWIFNGYRIDGFVISLDHNSSLHHLTSHTVRDIFTMKESRRRYDIHFS